MPVTIDANRPDAALTVPAGTMVVDDVDLSNELVGFLLGRYLPIFAGSATAKGKVSLLVREGAVPIVGDVVQQIRFDGVVGLAGAQLQPAGFLREALAMANLEREMMILPDQQLPVRVRDGQVVQERLLLGVGGYPVAVQGSLRLADQALDYWIEMPITLELAGGQRQLYALLKDEVIRVHVGGTAQKPRIAQDTYRENITRLLRTAGSRLLEQGGADLLRQGLDELFKNRKK